MTSYYRIITYLIALFPVFFISACNTIPETLVSADNAFVQGNYELALSLYERSRNERLSTDQATHTERRIEDIRQRLTQQALRESSTLAGKGNLKDYEERIQRLQQALPHDDNDRRIAREIATLRDALAQHRSTLDQRQSVVRASLQKGDWRVAGQQLAEALTLEPGYGLLSHFKPR